jgi:hypothetical protein
VRRAVAALAVLAALTVAASAPPPVEEEPLFAFQDDRITESSGLAVSALHDGVVYTHNDSGGDPVLFAVGPDGRTRAVLHLRDAKARDWEALAPGPDGTLWVGDIGDNGAWWDEIWVYRVVEPWTLRDADVEWTRYRLRYADGNRNAEALLVDPRTGRLYVVSKEDSRGGVYVAPPELRTGGVNELRRIADAPAEVTDGAFLPDGGRVVLRGYFSATVFDREWRAVRSLSVPVQRQGESLAATRDGTAVIVGSEGGNEEVWRVPLAEPAALAAPSTAAASEPPPSGATASGTSTQTKTVIGVLAGVVVLALAGVLIPRRR